MHVCIGVFVNYSLKQSDQYAKAAITANAVLGQINRAFHYRDPVDLCEIVQTVRQVPSQICGGGIEPMDNGLGSSAWKEYKRGRSTWSPA